MAGIQAFTLDIAKQAVQTLITPMMDSLKKELGKRRALANSEKVIQGTAEKLKHVLMVKTFWQLDKPVNLLDFYYPAKVTYRGKTKVVRSFASFGKHSPILIQGTVGQGKSMLSRYLTYRTMRAHKLLPVFFELRRLQPERSLVSHLLDYFQDLGIALDQDGFHFLAEKHKLALVLDGFDEVHPDQRQRLIDELEHLVKRHPKLPLVVTSRPQLDLAYSGHFTVFDMSPLGPEDLDPILEKLVTDRELLETLKRDLKHDQCRVLHLLTTPLMVVLLVMRYRLEASLPQNEVDFFKQLFRHLLSRHDASKPGFRRVRKSPLKDDALESVFDALAFATLKDGRVEMDLATLHGYLKRALEKKGLHADSLEVYSDLRDITCLLLEEGGYCRFVHKSVQEFHAAQYVAQLPDELARMFYGPQLGQRLIDDNLNWFKMLLETDPYRSRKYYALDMIKAENVYYCSRKPKLVIASDSNSVLLSKDGAVLLKILWLFNKGHYFCPHLEGAELQDEWIASDLDSLIAGLEQELAMQESRDLLDL